MTRAPYYADDLVTLYHGDCLEVDLPRVDLIVTDPPYGETSLGWDRWPDGWPSVAAKYSDAMWCFGSMRMFLDRRDEFADWKFSQDVVWRKNMGSGPVVDRFRRIHEFALHWYRGSWTDATHDTPRTEWHGPRRQATQEAGSVVSKHRNQTASRNLKWTDDGTRVQESVIDVRSMHRRAVHPTEKPIGIVDPLIRYGCPPGGSVLDLFAGSGTTLVAAKAAGRNAVGVEADEKYCEIAARRLSQEVLDFGGDVA